MDKIIEEFRKRRRLRLAKRIDEFKESEHPRDENGRFSSGGLSNESVKMTDEQFWEECDKINSNCFAYSDIDGLDKGIMLDAFKKSKELTNMFPYTKNIKITVKPVEELDFGTGASAEYDFSIKIPKNVWKSKDDMDKFVGKEGDIGFQHHKGYKREDMFVHETAHIIERALIEKMAGDKSENDKRELWNSGKLTEAVIKRAMTNAKRQTGKSEDTLVSEISKYARHGGHELFAEALSDYNRNRDKSAELSKAIVRQLQSILK